MNTNSYRRRQSSPATLLTRIAGMRQGEAQEAERQEEEIETQDGPSEPTEEEVMEGNYERQGSEWTTDHLTRLGVPDRRFLENRALTEEDVGLNYRRASSGKIVNGVHVTDDGTPDRRYKENRSLSDEDIEILRAELTLQKHGISRDEVSPTAILARHAQTLPRMEAPQVPSHQSNPKASGTRPKVDASGRSSKAPVQQRVANGTRRR